LLEPMVFGSYEPRASLCSQEGAILSHIVHRVNAASSEYWSTGVME